MRDLSSRPVPVVDLFAGAGGLGEGFSCLRTDGQRPFELALSIEQDPAAHETLLLRSMFHRFAHGRVPDAYYDVLRQNLPLDAFLAAFAQEHEDARQRVWRATLGSAQIDERMLEARLAAAIGGASDWVLVGGPPCQAYSVAGRSRNVGNADYRPEDDRRHFLYREYLRVLHRLRPAVFVLENVKGVLSSMVAGRSIFGRMLDDLQDPARALGEGSGAPGYRIYSLARESATFDLFGASDRSPEDHIVECERYGIPQRRHRVLLLGVRQDIRVEPEALASSPHAEGTVEDAIGDLPRLRSGLSGAADSDQHWLDAVGSVRHAAWLLELERSMPEVARRIRRSVRGLRVPDAGRGAEFLEARSPCRPRLDPDWFVDEALGGVCNHATRAHMPSDLHRYLFAAAFACVEGDRPLRLFDFPPALRPEHRNVPKALRHDNFSDRFRVQRGSKPATTVMSHIAKDGHYYIHHDPAQCRSLTVREAARLQTFPDNYCFRGNRTQQYTQVGNAVPPLLARQIAGIVHRLLGHAQSAGRWTGGREEQQARTVRMRVCDELPAAVATRMVDDHTVRSVPVPTTHGCAQPGYGESGQDRQALHRVG